MTHWWDIGEEFTPPKINVIPPHKLRKLFGLKPMIYTPEMNNGKNVFVFGSNTAGRHGKGAALEARRYWGAEYGVGRGRTGMSYAIPTKDGRLRPVKFNTLAMFAGEFLCYVDQHPDLNFLITRIGCGLAGFKDEDIVPYFATQAYNVVFPEEWERFLPSYDTYEEEYDDTNTG